MGELLARLACWLGTHRWRTLSYAELNAQLTVPVDRLALQCSRCRRWYISGPRGLKEVHPRG